MVTETTCDLGVCILVTRDGKCFSFLQRWLKVGRDFNTAAHVIKDLKRSYFILLKHRVVSMFHFITLLSGSGCLYAFFVPVGVATSVQGVQGLVRGLRRFSRKCDIFGRPFRVMVADLSSNFFCFQMRFSFFLTIKDGWSCFHFLEMFL